MNYEKFEPRWGEDEPRSTPKQNFRPQNLMAPAVPEVSLVFDHSHNSTQESRIPSSRDSTELSRSRDLSSNARTIDSYASWRQKRFSPDYSSSKNKSPNEVQYSPKSSNQESRQVQRSMSAVERNVAPRDQGNFKEEATRQMHRSHSAQTLPARMAIQHERDRQSLPLSRVHSDRAPSPRRFSETQQHLQRKRHSGDSHQSPTNNEIMQFQSSGQSSSCGMRSSRNAVQRRRHDDHRHLCGDQDYDELSDEEQCSCSPRHCPSHGRRKRGAASSHHCSPNTPDNLELMSTVKDLLKVVSDQNEQIRTLQSQINRLLSIPREQELQRMQQELLRMQQEFPEEQHRRQLQKVMEQKVSIGVMTSFELSVHNSQVYNNQAEMAHNFEATKKPEEETRESEIARKPSVNLRTRPPTLENIIEDSESHVSSKDTTINQRKSPTGNKGDTWVDEQTAKKNREEDSLFIDRDQLVVQRDEDSPEPSIHIDLEELSSDEDANAKRTSKVGWTFYNNVLGQVNRILHNSPNNEANIATKEQQFKKDVKNDAVGDAVKLATIQQLRKLGINFDEDELKENNEKRAIIDTSYYPRLDYKPNVTSGTTLTETNTSMKMRALALKYLSDDQLTDLAVQQQGMQQVTCSNLHGTNVSLATLKYLERYQLLPGKNQAQNEGNSNNTVSDQRVNRPMQNHILKQFASPNMTKKKILDLSTLKHQPKLL